MNLSQHLMLNPSLSRLTDLLRPPWCDYSAEELLLHFQTRTSVDYFALCDEEQAGPAKIDAILHDHFAYNGESYHLPLGFDWTINPSADREWLILLHKFYFAPGLGEAYRRTGDPRYLDKWVTLTDAWIDTVALDFLPSDVMGRRVQNWIFAHYYFVRNPAIPGLTPAFYTKFLQSLQQQVDYLCANLTPARNHRTLELYAIFMAAVVFPEFAVAAQWLELAQRELVRNIQADLRPDGVHCEQSTDYHQLVVKNYLGVKRLAAANHIDFDPTFDDLLQKALDFVLYVHKPDGLIPALSDGDSRSFLDLLCQGYELYGNRTWLYVATQGRDGVPPADQSRTFPAGGYTILRSGWGEGITPFADERYLIFDCGPLGEGNHGHLDLLSFEAAAYGQSLIVDPGRYTYHEPQPDSGEINWRARFRATAYHNTVQVDGLEQTRYAFHKRKFKVRGPEPAWALRAFHVKADHTIVHGMAASAEYDAIHERVICFAQGDYWIIADLLRAPTQHRYDLRFHLAATAHQQTHLWTMGNTQLLQSPHLLVAQPVDAQTEVVLEEGFVSRTYGVKEPAPVLRCTRQAATTLFPTVLYPYATEYVTGPPQLHLELLPLWQRGRISPPDEAFALQLTIRTERSICIDTFQVMHDAGTCSYQYHRRELS